MTETTMDQDRLVQRAEALVGLLKASNWDDEGTGKTQTSKAIEVAQDAPTLRVFISWLRYQAARESFWSVEVGSGREKTTLAEALADELNAVQKAQAGDHMPAVRLFLGYFRRALIGREFLDHIKVEG